MPEILKAVALIVAAVGANIVLRRPWPYRLGHCLIGAGTAAVLVPVVWLNGGTLWGKLLGMYAIFAYAFAIQWFRHRSWTRLFCDLYVVSAFPVHALMYGFNVAITHLSSGRVPLIVGNPILVADFPASPPKHRKQ